MENKNKNKKMIKNLKIENRKNKNKKKKRRNYKTDYSLFLKMVYLIEIQNIITYYIKQVFIMTDS